MKKGGFSDGGLQKHGAFRPRIFKDRKLMGREPNETETGIFAVMWSEHCGYKNSRPLLKLFPTEGKYVLQGPGENAGVVWILATDKQRVFKIRATITRQQWNRMKEPTGVGGIIA